MGAMRARKRRPVYEDDDDDLAAVILTSSDDEEANRDLTIDIVERARTRLEAKGAALTGIMIEEDVAGVIVDGAKKKRKKEKRSRKKVGEVVGVEVERKRRKKKKEEEKAQEPDEDAKVVDSTALKVDNVRLDETIQEKPAASPDSEVTEVNNVEDNMVLRKLLRGPRYFDTQVCNVQSYCFNCGEEGHVAVNCTEERRRKPCFVCGSYGHNPRHCLQGQDCFVCKRRGHVAKDCPNKRQRGVRDLKFCLHCGDYGHDMFSCRNPYSPEDLQEVQCYMCKEFGHLCCVDFRDSAPIGVSCYNCGQRDHAGVGCCKQQMQKMKADSPSLLCHICGEEGHFARGCTKKLKPDKWVDETSTPSRELKKHNDKAGSKSAPPYLGKPQKRNTRREWAGNSGSALGKKFEAKGASKSSPMGTPRQSRTWFPPEPLTRYKQRCWTGDDSPCAWGRKLETNGFHKPYPLVPLSGSHKRFPME